MHIFKSFATRGTIAGERARLYVKFVALGMVQIFSLKLQLPRPRIRIFYDKLMPLKGSYSDVNFRAYFGC
jgi:hypothetical protein